MSTKRVIFICSGNICRSPMAAALAPPMFEARGLKAMVISCGTLGIEGQPAAANARAAIEAVGLSLEGHRSQGTQAGLLRMADHLVVMAPRHTDALRRLAPDVTPKVVELWRHLPSQTLSKIDDPVGSGLETFVESRDEIAACLQAWIETL